MLWLLSHLKYNLPQWCQDVCPFKTLKKIYKTVIADFWYWKQILSSHTSILPRIAMSPISFTRHTPFFGIFPINVTHPWDTGYRKFNFSVKFLLSTSSILVNTKVAIALKISPLRSNCRERPESFCCGFMKWGWSEYGSEYAFSAMWERYSYCWQCGRDVPMQ